MLSKRLVAVLALTCLAGLLSVHAFQGDFQGDVFSMTSENAKSSWPEVVGKSFEDAKHHIEREAPDVKIFRVPEGSAVTMDWRPDRVRIVVDTHGTVIEPAPMRG